MKSKENRLYIQMSSWIYFSYSYWHSCKWFSIKRPPMRFMLYFLISNDSATHQSILYLCARGSVNLLIFTGQARTLKCFPYKNWFPMLRFFNVRIYTEYWGHVHTYTFSYENGDFSVRFQLSPFAFRPHANAYSAFSKGSVFTENGDFRKRVWKWRLSKTETFENAALSCGRRKRRLLKTVLIWKRIRVDVA